MILGNLSLLDVIMSVCYVFVFICFICFLCQYTYTCLVFLWWMPLVKKFFQCMYVFVSISYAYVFFVCVFVVVSPCQCLHICLYVWSIYVVLCMYFILVFLMYAIPMVYFCTPMTKTLTLRFYWPNHYYDQFQVFARPVTSQ